MFAPFFESLCLSLLCTVFKLAHFAMLCTDDDSCIAVGTFLSSEEQRSRVYLAACI